MDRTMQALALVALLLYIAPAALRTLTDGQRRGSGALPSARWRSAWGSRSSRRSAGSWPEVSKSGFKLGCFAAMHKIIAAHMKLD